MNCNQAQPLIPSYLDGELSEAQAGPLRKHLLDCQPCRGSAQGEKNLKRWFVDEEPVAVPRDFASRIARRAFAGDRGERPSFEPALPRFGVVAADADQDKSLRFVLQLTSLAAAALILVSLAIGSLKLPSGNKLQADSTREVKLERAIDELDRLNATENTRPNTEAGAQRTATEPQAKNTGADAARATNPAADPARAKNPSAGDARATNPSAGDARATNPSAGDARATK